MGSLPPFLFPLLSTVSGPVPSAVSFRISVPHLLSIKQQSSFQVLQFFIKPVMQKLEYWLSI